MADRNNGGDLQVRILLWTLVFITSIAGWLANDKAATIVAQLEKLTAQQQINTLQIERNKEVNRGQEADHRVFQKYFERLFGWTRIYMDDTEDGE